MASAGNLVAGIAKTIINAESKIQTERLKTQAAAYKQASSQWSSTPTKSLGPYWKADGEDDPKAMAAHMKEAGVPLQPHESKGQWVFPPPPQIASPVTNVREEFTNHFQTWVRIAVFGLGVYALYKAIGAFITPTAMARKLDREHELAMAYAKKKST